jgi:hypothetical protein
VTYDELVAAARGDDRVVGLVLTGSRGRDAFVRPGSDWDVRLIARDDAGDSCRGDYETPRGSPVEVVVLTLSDLERLPGWERYSYVGATIALDKLDGGIAGLAAAQGELPAAAEVAAAALDGYVNSLYRSLKNAGELESRLDAAESGSHVLDALFALHGRVRPYNTFLRWELDRAPLDGWDDESLPERLDAIRATGDASLQRELFRDVERLARERGHGATIDGWVPDLGFLRGGAG